MSAAIKQHIPLLFFVMLVWGCKTGQPDRHTATLTHDYDQYETYAFGRADIVGKENPVFNWPQLSDRITNELNFILPNEGLDYSTANPDLIVFFYVLASSEQSLPLLPYQIGWKAEPFLAAGERFEKYPSNTLVIDFVDAKLNELVWRGSASLPFDEEKRVYEQLPEKIRPVIRDYPYPPGD